MSESDEEEVELPPWNAFGGERRLGDVERQLNEPVSPFLPRHEATDGGGSRKCDGWEMLLPLFTVAPELVAKSFSAVVSRLSRVAGEDAFGNKSLVKFMLQSKPFNRRITECASNWKRGSYGK